MAAIFIGMPTASGSIPALTVNSLIRLAHPFHFAWTARMPTHLARNVITKDFLGGDIDYLLFLDDDNPIPPDAISKFVAADKDIIVGPILCRRTRQLCAYYDDGKGYYQHITKFREEGPLHRIDMGVTACMFIKRHVLETLHEKHGFQIFEYVPHGDSVLNEDTVFCQRATAAGFEIWLHEEVRPQHIADPEVIRWDGKLPASGRPALQMESA